MKTIACFLLALFLLMPAIATTEANQGEIIGEVVLPCECPGYITWIEPLKYRLDVPTHGHVLFIAVVWNGEKMEMNLSGGDIFTSVAPYDTWIWISSDGTITQLEDGALGDNLADIISKHMVANSAKQIDK